MKKIKYQEITETIDDTLRFIGNPADIDFIVGISRGGLFPAMYVATKLNKPLVVAYIDKQDNVYFDREEWVKEKSVLLVDDIIKTGKTISKIKDLLLEKGVKGVDILTVFYLLKNSSTVPTNTKIFSKLIKVDVKLPWDHEI